MNAQQLANKTGKILLVGMNDCDDVNVLEEYPDSFFGAAKAYEQKCLLNNYGRIDARIFKPDGAK
jgi:hypothetical protein